MYLIVINRTLRGGALYYAIFVVFVLSVISSLFLLQRGFMQKQLRQELGYFTATDDINSALTLYLSAPEKYQSVDSNLICLFGDSTRVVKIKRGSHGLLNLLIASRDYRGIELSKALMVGKDPFWGDSLALYVPEKNQSLFASGSSRINGNAVIPARGIQRASIEGKPLERSQVVSGTMSRSQEALPALSSRLQQKIKELQQSDSLLRYATPIAQLSAAKISQPIGDNIRWYYSDSDFQVSGISASGAIGFISGGSILIRKDALLEGVLVSAQRIVVEDGFRGTLQLFAGDSLVIGDDCRLGYPSVVCVNNRDVSNTYVSIGKNSNIEGCVLVTQDALSAQEPRLILSDGSNVTGQVYHQGDIQMEGSIYGSLYCEGFYLKTRRAYYENHLLDNVIDFEKLPQHFVAFDLIHGYDDQIIEVLDCSL